MINLVSIIIPCFNAVEYTKQCIESILQQTNMSYELILINNGSSDGTKEYFKILKKKLKPNEKLQKIIIVQAEKNLGVAKALNLGISKSIGKYICYLNNDVIVTKDWLKKLVNVSKSDKKIGAVGTMFNAFKDKQIIKNLGKTLGKTDKDGQVSQIELSLTFLNSQLKKAEQEELKKAKLYKTLGATIGMAIVIILI